MQSLYTIDGFTIKRDYVKSISGYGETAFRRVWKELKDKGVLTESKTSIKGRYEYVYTLKNNEDTVPKVVAAVDKKKAAVPGEKKHIKIDSDGNALMDGQVTIDEVLEVDQQQEVLIENENIAVVAKTTGLTNSEALELLKETNNDVTKVIECHKYSVAQDNVRDIFNYTKWAIKNNKVLKCPKEYAVKDNFNNYPQRTYDFDKLEKALLYGEQYEFPA